MTRKTSRVNPIRNYREGSPRERAYDRRNALIALAAQPVVVGAILLIFRCDLRTALLGLSAVDFGVLALVAIPVAAMLMRNDAATGLAAIGGVTTVNVDAVSLAMQRTFDCEPQRAEREGQVLLACKTLHSNLSYGEWIVASVTRQQDQLVTVEAFSWNTSPTVTFGINRRISGDSRLPFRSMTPTRSRVKARHACSTAGWRPTCCLVRRRLAPCGIPRQETSDPDREPTSNGTQPIRRAVGSGR
jgi:uncharacterized membrane protein